MDRKSPLVLCCLSEFALHPVDHLHPAECPRHHLCGVAAHRAWGEGTMNDSTSYCFHSCLTFVFFIRPTCPSTLTYWFMFLQVPLPKEAIASTPPLSLQISRSQASPLSFQLQLLSIDGFSYCTRSLMVPNRLRFLIPQYSCGLNRIHSSAL